VTAAVTVTAADEVLPRPKAVTGSVFVDAVARTATVRISELENSYNRSLWSDGWLALRQSYESGWPRGGPPWVYCDGRRDVHGVPVEGGGLTFHWPVGTEGFADLVSRPGLYAIATVDINTHYISTVKFLHRTPA
jgi:hypothetical protein